MLRSRSRCRSAAGFHLVQTSTSPNSTRYFDDEVPVVRSTTADAPPPSFLPTACSFSEFQSMIVDDVMAVDGALPDKDIVYSSRCGQHTSRSSSRRYCSFPQPTLPPIVSASVVAVAFRAACITALLKKSDMNPRQTFDRIS